MRTLTAPSPSACLWSTRGHRASITDLSLSPDGTRLLSCDSLGEVSCWTADGARVASAKRHQGARAVRWLGTGGVSFGDDARAVFFDADLSVTREVSLPGRPRFVAGPTDAGLAVALVDGWIGSMSPDGTLTRWALDGPTEGLLAVGPGFVRCTRDDWQHLDASGRVLRSGSLQALTRARLTGVSLRPVGERVLLVLSGDEMELYTTVELALLEPHTGAVERRDEWVLHYQQTPFVAPDGGPLYFVAATPTGPQHDRMLVVGNSRVSVVAGRTIDAIFTGSIDGALRRWTLDAPRLELPTAGVFVDGAARREGELCTFEEPSGQLHWWSAEDGRLLRSEKVRFLARPRNAVSSDGRSLVGTSHQEGRVGAVLTRLDPAWESPPGAVPGSAVLSANARFGAREGLRYQLRAFDPETGTLSLVLTSHASWGGVTAVGPHHVVTWDHAGVVCGWRLGANAPHWKLQLAEICAGVACRDGAIALLLHRPNVHWVVWLDAATGAVLVEGQPTAAALALDALERPDGAIVSSGTIAAVFPRAAAPGRSPASVSGGHSGVTHECGRFALHRTHAGEWSVLGLDDDSVRPLGKLAVTETAQLGVRPDGACWLALGLDGGEVVIVDLVAAEVVTRWKAHDGKIEALRSDALRQRLLSVGKDGRARVWNVETREQLDDLAAPRGSLDFVGFHHDAPVLWGSESRALSPLDPARDARELRWLLLSSPELVVFDLDERVEVRRALCTVTQGLREGALSDDGRYAFNRSYAQAELVSLSDCRRQSLAPEWTLRRKARFLSDSRLLLLGEDVRVVRPDTGATTLHRPLLEAGEKLLRVEGGDARVAWAVSSPEGCSLRACSLSDGAELWRTPLDEPPIALHVFGDTTVVVSPMGAQTFDARGVEVSAWAGSELLREACPFEHRGALRIAVVDVRGRLVVLAD